MKLCQSSSMLINQLREITGIQDLSVLHETLKAADGDLMDAVEILTEGHPKESGQELSASEPSDCEGSSANKEQETSTIDPVPHNQADLQKCIPSRSQNFPAICAVLADSKATANVAHEASAAGSKNRPKRKRCEVWGESVGQNGWRRTDAWPVGMRNIGNTCWFSAVIQSLFHLPEFRHLVLGYSVPDNVFENCQSRSRKRNIAFMQDLQCLFALMLGTVRKFVDPTAALELLRGAFRSPDEQQQDVSEFTHKLLDWLEDAFQVAVNGNSPQDKSENPMVQLFYGTFLTEGIHEGKTFSKIETFGQYPLQVNGYKNLNECLEGAMIERETESPPSDPSVKYGQERWFTKLPPVLTFELSRFEFNQSLGQPEKIHSKLEFSQVIYMDRFLYNNKELIQARREEIKQLKGQIALLQQKLESYMKYGSGEDRFPLRDMLLYVLEFASTRTTPAEPKVKVHTAETPPVHSREVVTQPIENSEDDVATSYPELADRPFRFPWDPAEMPAHPAPHVVTEDEMSLVMTCLQRWRKEVEQDMQGLQNSIVLLTETIELMYADPSLEQVPYHLHAVLVHEGQANAGHYWAYVYNQPRKSWLKYNDISVTEASWEELQRDSFGGLKNASAYCLMYISEPLFHSAADEGNSGQFRREVEALRTELQHYIQEHNWRVEQEIAEWEEEQSCKMAQMEESESSVESQYLSTDSGQELSPPSEHGVHALSSEHAVISKDQTIQAIANSADAYEKNGVEAALVKSKGAEPAKEYLEEANLTTQAEEEQGTVGEAPAAPALPSSQVSEVEIPSVGRILVRSDADGYNEEVMLSPAMQGVILAIAKARQTFDRDGSEAGLVKAFHEEYSRLYQLSKEIPTPQNDHRLQHVLVYLLQNGAPKRVVERTLLEQFADKNLSFDERSISIMKVARAKLKDIGPDDIDMEEYRKWHEDYSLFRKVSVYLLTGLELFQNEKYCEALTYLVYAYQSNTTLLSKGPRRGVDAALIALYRRKCLLKLNDAAATLFESHNEVSVTEGINHLNELIIPCMHLIVSNNLSKEDLDAIEVMRSRWCSYLGKDMNEDLQLKLGELLPRLLDCSAEGVVLKEPPKIRPNSPYDLCSRFAAVMESIHRASAVTVS
ncbi:ubiquitin carboxyl-terminal hydrolase 28 isoform X12 [Paroedura picta]|uniref:ubiquitin carboxyl-terminal hydrolase 28 isoform X12 n=1 Tax=Paroedura picta TaxID=143630 RepID=UPI0040579217